jgi:Ca2+-binding EF-hand superfamily protein
MAKITRGTGRLLFVALALLVSAAAISSDDSHQPVPPPFSVHDTDRDGYLSREEYEVFYEDFAERHRKSGRPAYRMLEILRFDQIDSDGDGRISVDEMVSALRERRQGPGWRWKRETN